jgi:Spy/CpxP family protein refolding chaperone
MNSNRFWLIASVLLMALMLLTAGNRPAPAEPAGRHYKLEWQKLAKELDLSSKQDAAFQAVGAKYSQTRKALIEKLQKNETDLEKAVSGPKPDMNRVKKLVPGIIADHNQLFESFKLQRQEEMSLLTPLQQAKYLLALKKWHEENRGTAKAAQ